MGPIKLLLPIAVAGLGLGAIAYASTEEGTTAVASGAPAAWIDGPLGDRTYAPGTIEVVAHATADEPIPALELVVDGEVAATDDDLEETDKLVRATFAWEATEGSHALQVRATGGSRAASAVRTIQVGGATAPSTTTSAGPATTTTAPATTTTSAATSTTTIVEEGPTTTAPPAGATTIPATPTPTLPPTTAPPRPTTTTAPPRPAQIDSATTRSPYGDGKVYVPACGYTMEVTAVVRDAERVRASVEGTAVSGDMARSGTTYTFTIRSGTFAPGDVGVHRVLVTATGGGASPIAVAGRVTVVGTCPKD